MTPEALLDEEVPGAILDEQGNPVEDYSHLDGAPESFLLRQYEKACDIVERAAPPDRTSPDAPYDLSRDLWQRSQPFASRVTLMRDLWDPGRVWSVAEITTFAKDQDFLAKRHRAKRAKDEQAKWAAYIADYESKHSTDSLFDAPPAQADKKSHIYVERFDAIEPRFDRLGLVKGLLDHNAMSVLYGESWVGKTLVALSLAYHIGSGRAWWGGRTLQQGLVVYVATEGGYGVRNRLVALRERYGAEQTVRLALIPCPVDLSGRGADVQPLLDAIAAVGRPSLIIVDTLSRALHGGDENSSEGMGDFIKNADRLRTATGAHLMAVHHSGKDTAKGARGHSSLRAATDTELEVIHDPKTGERKILVRKQRDIDALLPVGFAIEAVEIGADPEGVPVSAPIAVHRDLRAEGAFRQVIRAGSVTGRALTILENLTMSTPSATVDSWYAEFARTHYADKPKKVSWQAFERANKELLAAGLIGIEKGRVTRLGECPQNILKTSS